mgnify:CR=1 FL=1
MEGEHVDGHDLRELLKRAKENERPVPLEVVVAVGIFASSLTKQQLVAGAIAFFAIWMASCCRSSARSMATGS